MTVYVHRTIEKQEIPRGDRANRRQRRGERAFREGYLYRLTGEENPDEGWKSEGPIPQFMPDNPYVIALHIWPENGRVTTITGGVITEEGGPVFVVTTGFCYNGAFFKRSHSIHCDVSKAMERFNLKVAFGEVYGDIYLIKEEGGKIPYRTYWGAKRDGKRDDPHR